MSSSQNRYCQSAGMEPPVNCRRHRLQAGLIPPEIALPLHVVLAHVRPVQVDETRLVDGLVGYRVRHQLALYSQVPLVGFELESPERGGSPLARASMISNRSMMFCVATGVVLKLSIMSGRTVL